MYTVIKQNRAEKGWYLGKIDSLRAGVFIVKTRHHL